MKPLTRYIQSFYHLPLGRLGGAFLLCFLVICGTAAAQQSATPEQQAQLISEINAAAKDIQTLQCDFTQMKTLSIMNDKMVSQGAMTFAQPAKLRWRYTTPYDYTFIISDDKVHIAKGSKRNSIDIKSSQVFQEIVRLMAGSVTGRCLTQTKDFSVKMLIAEKSYIAVLTPKDKQLKKMFQTIRLTFDRARKIVTTVEMTEATGDATVIEFQHIQQNKPVSAKTFSLD